MIRGIIDIGTNSVRLLVAERLGPGEWRTILKKLKSTRLGEGMTGKADITEAARARTLEAVREFAVAARMDGADEIFGYGTSIMRDAPQGKAFAEEIKKATGVSVRILRGEEEAFYSYIGAAGLSNVVNAVADIGGGSTEICMGFGTDIGYRVSFPLGCVRCSCQFDVTTTRGLAELKKHCFDVFKEAEDAEAVKRWICVGGTATTMAAMLQNMTEYDPKKIQDYVLHQEAVENLLKKLYTMSYEDRCHLKGLRPDRADIIVAGVAILDSLMEYFALSEITVSDRDLVEGLLDADVTAPKQ